MKRSISAFCAMWSIPLVMLLSSAPASAQFSYTNDFSAVPACAEGAWIARYEKGDGTPPGDAGDYCPMSDRVPQDAGSATGNGDYMNFYTNYGDPKLVAMQAQVNIGGFGVPGGGGYPGNDGEHTFSACVYVPEVADGGADFGSGVDVGMKVSLGSNGYSPWSGDTVAESAASLSFSGLARGTWSRQSVTFTAANSHRVDAGFYSTHPQLDTAGYPSSAVYIDDMYVGFTADAPVGGCYEAADAGAGAGGGDATSIPVLPLWALFGLAGLIGLMGLRRKA